MRGRGLRGTAKKRTAGAVGHALAFLTWRSLVREQGLTQEQTVDLMSALCEQT